MKILDRYIVATFIKNYLISFFVLIGMYVTLDMVFNFDELVQVQDRAGVSGVESAWNVVKSAADYYFYQIAVIYVHLSGMIPVVAAAFTLLRLSRFNELSAMMAAGVPLLRVASPIIIVALVLNAMLLVDQELIIPHIIPKLTRSRQDAGQEQATGHFAIPAMQDDKGAVLNAARYKPAPGVPTMYEFTLIERTKSYQFKSRVVAKTAQWDADTRSWVLTEGMRIASQRPDEDADPSAARGPRIQTNVTRYSSNVTPEEINLYRSGNYVELLSTKRIDELLDRPKSYGQIALLRVKHWRFTQPLVNIILLLLAIPCVLTREPTRLKASATKCLLLSGLCLVAAFLGQQLAGQAPNTEWRQHWPALMAWMPILLFGPVAVYLLDRVET